MEILYWKELEFFIDIFTMQLLDLSVSRTPLCIQCLQEKFYDIQRNEKSTVTMVMHFLRKQKYCTVDEIFNAMCVKILS